MKVEQNDLLRPSGVEFRALTVPSSMLEGLARRLSATLSTRYPPWFSIRSRVLSPLIEDDCTAAHHPMIDCSLSNCHTSANTFSWTSHLGSLAAGGGGVPEHGLSLLAVLLDDDGPHHDQKIFPLDRTGQRRVPLLQKKRTKTKGKRTGRKGLKHGCQQKEYEREGNTAKYRSRKRMTGVQEVQAFRVVERGIYVVQDFRVGSLPAAGAGRTVFSQLRALAWSRLSGWSIFRLAPLREA